MGVTSPEVTVVIPWRPGCPWRERALAHTLGQWPDSWQIVIAEDPTAGPFCKGAAYAVGVAQAVGELFVMADGDVLIPGLHAALDAVRDGAPWSRPFSRLQRLTEPATEAVYAGQLPSGPLVEPPYGGHAAAACLVTTTATARAVPIDPRFVGWGLEDDAHALALGIVAGPGRFIPGPIWHLWHPPQPRPHRHGHAPGNRELLMRYRKAARRGQLDDVVAEARHAAAQWHHREEATA